MESTAEQKPEIRAVQYMFRATHYARVSTDQQQHSTNNQTEKIKAYAAEHGMKVVRTYADQGKSCPSVGGRASLKKLIADVKAGDADFNVILVYDVSRWGQVHKLL